VAGGIAFVLLVVSCKRPEVRHPNILLITLDTFRADRVNANTPDLQRLARSGTSFLQADSAVPLTLPSHATILSGLLPLHRRFALARGFETYDDAIERRPCGTSATRTGRRSMEKHSPVTDR